MVEEAGHDEGGWRWRVKFALLGFAVTGAFLLLVEHRAHVQLWWPWLFLAGCLLMHVFMHHGHGSPGPATTSHHHGGDRS